MPSRIALVIPAYRPGPQFQPLIATLSKSGFLAIFIINDGSGPEYEEFFDAVRPLHGVRILRQVVNLGKGAALKTGLNAFLCEFPDGIGAVTADADGQHAPDDIVQVAEKLRDNPGSLVLGSRSFDQHTPLRSRLGNSLTRTLVRCLMGQALADTQTGLRGIPASLIPELLRVPSSGYEFELDMLVAAKHYRVPVIEQAIRTIYLDGNRSSHFNPLLDSMRIYFVLFRFTVVALITALIDNLVFLASFTVTGNILGSQIAGRLVAMVFNYTGARRAVFFSRQKHQSTLTKYLALVAINCAVSYALINLGIRTLAIPVLWAKLAAEGLLFIANFAIQRDFVFTRSAGREVADPPVVPKRPSATPIRTVAEPNP